MSDPIIPNRYEIKYGSPYPKNPPPHEIPHNILRFFKKIPDKILPKLLALTRLDTVMRDVLLATISLDGPAREELVKELEVLAKDLEEPLQKLVGSFGDSIKTVFQAMPGLNIVYAVSDIADVLKDGKESSGEVTTSMNDFIDNVKDIYDRSAGSNRLVSSMLYALTEYLDKTQMSGIKDKVDSTIGSRIQSEKKETADKQLSDIKASKLSRSLSKIGKTEGLTKLLSLAEENPDADEDIKNLITGLKDAIKNPSSKKILDKVKSENTSTKGLKKLSLVDSISEE
jgi:methyl-accepting chemotaxis protein